MLIESQRGIFINLHLVLSRPIRLCEGNAVSMRTSPEYEISAQAMLRHQLALLTEREGQQPCTSVRPYLLGVASVDTEVQPTISTKVPLVIAASITPMQTVGRSGRASTYILYVMSPPVWRSFVSPSMRGHLFPLRRASCLPWNATRVSTEVDIWYLSPGIPGQHSALAPNFHTDGRTGSKPLPVEPANRAFSHEQGRRARTGGGSYGAMEL